MVRSTAGIGRLSRAAFSFSMPDAIRARTRSTDMLSAFAMASGSWSTNSTFFFGLWCISPRSPTSKYTARTRASSAFTAAFTSSKVQVK